MPPDQEIGMAYCFWSCLSVSFVLDQNTEVLQPTASILHRYMYIELYPPDPFREQRLRSP